MEPSQELSQESTEAEEESAKRKQILTGLIDESKECQEKINQRPTKESLDIMTSILEKCNNVRNEGNNEDRIGHSGELVLDAHIISISHKMVSNMFECVSQFNEQSFANGIRDIVKNNKWEELLKLTQPISRTAHVKSSMLGAIESQPKLSIARQRYRRSDNVNLEQKPEEFKKLQRCDEGAEKVNMAHKIIVNYLRSHEVDSIPFYKLIVVPNDLMKSVDNALQLAFMVKEKSIYIFKGDDGYPAVTLNNPEKHVETNECECVLNFEVIKKFTDIYNIKEPILKYNDS